MRNALLLDLSDAKRLARSAMAAAAEAGLAVHVAVCDATGALLLYLRMDGANAVSGEIAQAKALTAAGTGADTADLAPRTLPGEPGWGLQHLASGRLTTLAGGVVLRSDGVVIGGLGISGASVAQDAALAEAARSAW
jgi:uncharacterized protein GlcG (DUF336 family)